MQNVTVTLFGLSDVQSYSIEILLTGPTNQGVDLMSDAGNGLVTNATVTIEDAGVPFPGGEITSGTYQPSGASYPSGTAFTFGPFSWRTLPTNWPALSERPWPALGVCMSITWIINPT